MKVLIFEGIASSGKTTIIFDLKNALPGLSIMVANEAETHIPIMKETADKHIVFFKSLVQKLASENPDVLIFDRLYLTQAFRAKCTIKDYAEIEELLSMHSPLTIYLKVDEDIIADRIMKASKHRGSDYFQSRGETLEEIAHYYIDQQQNQLELLEESTLPNKIFDTTEHNYEEIVQKIIKYIVD